MSTPLPPGWDASVSEGQPIDFKRGQVLFYEGHIPYGVFVILSGHVSLVEGHSPCLHEHSRMSPQGLVFGLDAALEGIPSCCTCVADEDCRAVFVSKTLLQRPPPGR
jgi:CRP-like cAMP-binding protein